MMMMLRTIVHSRSVRLGGHLYLSPLAATNHAAASGSSSNIILSYPSNSHFSTPTQPSRSFWSSTTSSSSSQEDEGQTPEKKNKSTTAPPHLLPIPPLTPSNISATSLLPNSTIESLKCLPEIQSALDILYHSRSTNSNSNQPTNTQQLHSNLQRARDILQSLPELHSSTYLISTDLYALCGQFDLALESLGRYNHLLQQQQHQPNGKMKKMTKQQRVQLQFVQAKLYTLSGQFTLALSEYEDLLEKMEQDVERQMKQQHNQPPGGVVSVIDGAATLTGVGLTKLLLLLYQEENKEENNNHDTSSSSTTTTTTAINEIMEAMETSTEMLLESRQDALHSPKHADLAIDLGIAASISLTNLGVAHCLLGKKNKVKSIEQWKKGIDTLDALLSDAMNTATIIPRHKFLWMESIRARLHCDIACLLLGLVDPSSSSSSPTTKKQLDDDTLKLASEAAKKGLDIYDELINGAKILRGENDDGGSSSSTHDGNNIDEEDNDDNKKEWERILKEEVKKKKKQENDDDDNKPPEVSLSPLWIDYHRCESARALGLVAHCYAQAGAAVTSEGLFQSALDASSSYPFGQSLRSSSSSSSNFVHGGKGIALSSPNLAFIARDVRLWYAMLCNNWEKRKGDADRLLADAQKIDKDMVFQGYSSSSQEGKKKRISGMISSLWLFNPIDFERK